jgi:hypothetical protein
MVSKGGLTMNNEEYNIKLTLAEIEAIQETLLKFSQYSSKNIQIAAFSAKIKVDALATAIRYDYEK